MYKLLIVEDEETLLEALKITLIDEGYDIDATNNGADALQLLMKKKYDIIVSDMHLGDTSGINILKASCNMNPDTKFILITAFSSIESAIEAIHCGIYDYILKPFDITELKFRVKHAIDKLETERKHRDAEERYRIIMDNIPYGIAIISPEMEIIEVNKQIKEWFPSINASETPPCFKIFCNPPQDTICPECAVIKTLKTGKRHEQLRYVPCKGVNSKIRATTNPIFDSQNQVVAVLKVLEIVKEEKE